MASAAWTSESLVVKGDPSSAGAVAVGIAGSRSRVARRANRRQCSLELNQAKEGIHSVQTLFAPAFSTVEDEHPRLRVQRVTAMTHPVESAARRRKRGWLARSTSDFLGPTARRVMSIRYWSYSGAGNAPTSECTAPCHTARSSLVSTPASARSPSRYRLAKHSSTRLNSVASPSTDCKARAASPLRLEQVPRGVRQRAAQISMVVVHRRARRRRWLAGVGLRQFYVDIVNFRHYA